MNGKAIRSKGWKSGVILLLGGALAACSGGGGGGLPSPGASGGEGGAGGQTVVSMAVMTKDRFLEEAEQKFEAAHPDIDIQIEETVPRDTGSDGKMMISKNGGQAAGPAPEDVDKYVNAVNTAIMSGKAADLISIERLPFDKYIEKGLLADWNELADQDGEFRKSDYYERVLSGISGGNGEGWYGIPTSLTLSVMVGDAALLKEHGLDDKTWTWDQFVKLLEEQSGAGKYGIAMVKPEDLLAYLVETVYGQLIAKDGGTATFDAAAFRAYMEEIKRLYDDGLATADPAGAGGASFNQVSMQHPVEMAIIPRMRGGEGSEAKLLRPPGTGQDEGIPFKSDQVLALNAKSEVKEAAWSFAKFLLSEEMQSSNSLLSFSVHKKALETKLKQMQEKLAGGGGEGGRMSLQVKGPDGESSSIQLSDEDIEQIIAVLPSVGKYEASDAKVLNMIREETAAYFSGSKTAEAVTGSLAGRITTYLNE